MQALLQQIENYKAEILLAEATTVDAVEAFRIKYLGTKGLLKNVMSEIKNVPNEDKKDAGQVLNSFKALYFSSINILKDRKSHV